MFISSGIFDVLGIKDAPTDDAIGGPIVPEVDVNCPPSVPVVVFRFKV